MGFWGHLNWGTEIMLLGDRLEWSCNCWERAGNFCRLPTTSGIDGSIYWKRTCPIRHCPTVRLPSLPVATTVAAHKMSCGLDSVRFGWDDSLQVGFFHGIQRIFTHVQRYDSFNVFFKRCQVRFRMVLMWERDKHTTESPGLRTQLTRNPWLSG